MNNQLVKWKIILMFLVHEELVKAQNVKTYVILGVILKVRIKLPKTVIFSKPSCPFLHL
jgi:hypothetical protein